MRVSGRGRAKNSRSIKLSLTQIVTRNDQENSAREQLMKNGLEYVEQNRSEFLSNVHRRMLQFMIKDGQSAPIGAKVYRGPPTMYVQSTHALHVRRYELRCAKCHSRLCDSIDIYRRGESQYVCADARIWLKVVHNPDANTVDRLQRAVGEHLMGKMMCASGMVGVQPDVVGALLNVEKHSATCLMELGCSVLYVSAFEFNLFSSNCSFEKAYFLQLKPNAFVLVDKNDPNYGVQPQLHSSKKWSDIVKNYFDPIEFDWLRDDESRRRLLDMQRVRVR
jgi:hypothetical protein